MQEQRVMNVFGYSAAPLLLLASWIGLIAAIYARLTSSTATNLKAI